MSEYHIGHPVKGVIGVIISIITLIFIPKIVLNVLQDPYWLTTFLHNFNVEFDSAPIAELLSKIDTTGIQGIIQRMIDSAIPLVILSFPLRFYDDGNKGKMYFGLIKSVYCIIRYLYVMNFGVLDNIFGIEIDGYFMSFDIVLTGALLLAIFFRILKMPKIVAIYKDARDEFVDNHIEDGEWVNRSKKELKEMKREEKLDRKERIKEANRKHKDDDDY